MGESLWADEVGRPFWLRLYSRHLKVSPAPWEFDGYAWYVVEHAEAQRLLDAALPGECQIRIPRVHNEFHCPAYRTPWPGVGVQALLEFAFLKAAEQSPLLARGIPHTDSFQCLVAAIQAVTGRGVEAWEAEVALCLLNL